MMTKKVTVVILTVMSGMALGIFLTNSSLTAGMLEWFSGGSLISAMLISILLGTIAFLLNKQ